MFQNPKYPGRPAHASHMRELLGLKGTAKLPPEGMSPRLVQGHVVWVAPLMPKPAGMPKGNKVHRIMCRCPGCSAPVPAGRLYQHKCKTQTDWRIRSREGLEEARWLTGLNVLNAKECEGVIQQVLNHTLRRLPLAEALENIQRIQPCPGTSAAYALHLFACGLPQP